MLKNKKKENIGVTFSKELTQVHTVDNYKRENKAHSQTQFKQDFARLKAAKEEPVPAQTALKPAAADVFSMQTTQKRNDLNIAGSKLLKKEEKFKKANRLKYP